MKQSYNYFSWFLIAIITHQVCTYKCVVSPVTHFTSKSANSKPPMRPDVYNLSKGATLGCANFDSHPSSHLTSIITECLRLGWKKGLWKLAQPAHPGFTPIVLTYFHVQMWFRTIGEATSFLLSWCARVPRAIWYVGEKPCVGKPRCGGIRFVSTFAPF